MQLSVTTRMGVDEFFLWVEKEERRHELVDGVPVAMAGANRRHDRIVVNVLGEFRNQLRGRRCSPFTADTAVRIPNGNIRLPDVGVDCGTFNDSERAADHPTVVVEVLSPSTRQFDLFRKLEEYKSVPSIAHILIVDPDEPEAIHWRRGEQGWAHQVHESLEAAVVLDEPALTLRFADVYEGLRFQPRPRLVLDEG